MCESECVCGGGVCVLCVRAHVRVCVTCMGVCVYES